MAKAVALVGFLEASSLLIRPRFRILKSLLQASVASASNRLDSSKARVYQQGSLEKDWLPCRRRSESRTELIQELPSGRSIRSWVEFDSLTLRTMKQDAMWGRKYRRVRFLIRITDLRSLGRGSENMISG